MAVSDTGTLQTDEQTDRIAISISRISVLMHDKNCCTTITTHKNQANNDIKFLSNINGQKHTVPKCSDKADRTGEAQTPHQINISGT